MYPFFMKYDVVIIGAGISGCCIARELSKYRITVCILEKENDVSCGTSKANSGIIHAGYDPPNGSLMARFNVEGCALYPQLAEELNFDYRQIGSLVLAFTKDEQQHLQKLYQQGLKNRVQTLQLLTADKTTELERNLSPDVVSALYAPTAGIISPYQAVWAFAENAVQNGIELKLNTQVCAIIKDNNRFRIQTGHGQIETDYIINAAGLYADHINTLAGAQQFTIHPRRGEYVLFDNKCNGLVNHIIFQTPGKLGKGVLISPTVDGNILAGPNAIDVNDKDDTVTTQTGRDYVLKTAERSVPALPLRNIINSFAGNRAILYKKDEQTGTETQVHDFIIEEDPTVPHFITVAGITSPGLTAAPAIARYIPQLLAQSGLVLIQKKDFDGTRSGIPSFKRADTETRKQLLTHNPLYGRIICRCEMITEAEIVAAIHSPVGATDLDGIKRRTRCGMGRCQGGFCVPKITDILSRELGISMTDITKCGQNSFILNSQTRKKNSGDNI